MKKYCTGKIHFMYIYFILCIFYFGLRYILYENNCNYSSYKICYTLSFFSLLSKTQKQESNF